ncbi:uncharacterized protein LOC128232585 [Mya arenaria]|uniref:uncharacterized protein LOC128232585 n=1 Tax=Mya arenaria TaxID=6604 RepID=UPI0022E8066A|nr:uncharacterized protein LOC128232585 [Mya arenaria]XP_052802194.1 uncharacterized protein LOC128232585 [Mya arenaria]
MSTTAQRKRVGGGYKNVEVKERFKRGEDQRYDKDFSDNETYDRDREFRTNYKQGTQKQRHHKGGSSTDDSFRLPHIDNKNNSLVSSQSPNETDNEIESEKGDYGTEKGSGRSEERRQMDAPILELREKTSASLRNNGNAKNSGHQSKQSAVYDANPILRYVDENVFGKDLVIETPFGSRNVVYCDYTASGRCLQFIEDYIQTKVMPTYANTHSTTGHNARQTGKFREEARNIIKKCVNANNDDVAIFTGSGATAGMHKIAWTLRINTPRVAAETAVFIGPYEHHSNILLWREYGTKVVRIRHEPDHGQIDLIQLQEELQFWKDKRRVLLVCMSAASNVTGIITDVDAVARIAHQNGALAIFDYAAGGPYLKIDMNPSKTEYKDAVILSPHKFVGGPGTPGLILAKKWMFRNSVPDRVGGGTVRFVTRDLHSYVGNIEEREEGGTPAIIESIRAGIIFKLKEEIGADVIHARELELCNRAFTAWESNPSIYVMGSHTADRVCIFSFLTISQETGRLVHHNFISTLLSDVFGIQARGGCACAGPYAEDLMGISEPMAKKYLWFLSEKPQRKDPNKHVQDPLEIMKPGFTRVNLSYFLDNETADFIIEAVNMVTKHGWKLLPEYSFDPFTGSWKHKSFSNTMESQLESLSSFDPTGNKTSEQTGKPTDYQTVLQKARDLFESADCASRPRIMSASLSLRDALPRDKRRLRWFLTPHDAACLLSDKDEDYLDKKPYDLPFKLPNLRSRFVSNRYDSDDEEDDNIRYDPHTQTDKHTKHRSRRTHKDVDISPALSSRSVPEKRITNPHDTHRGNNGYQRGRLNTIPSNGY